MREIREVIFRGKRTDNGEWVKGYLYITHIGSHEIGSYDAEINIERLTFDVIPETVGQYTGLTDKNGVRIFEGDIVRYEDDIGYVIYNGDDARFLVDSPNMYISMDYSNEFEVIGNIHDNSELLKGGEDNG